MILRLEIANRVARSQTDGDDAPICEIRLQRNIGIDSLMRPVECPEAEMDDALLQRYAVEIRPRHVRGKRCRGRQALHGQDNP